MKKEDKIYFNVFCIEFILSLLTDIFLVWGFLELFEINYFSQDFLALLIKYSIQVSVAFEHQKHNGTFKHVLAFAVAL